MKNTVRSKPKPVKEPKKKKRKVKTARQLLEIKADKLAREIVLKRDGRCVCPAPLKGHSEVLQPGHLITRGKESVKWDLRNLNCQCSSCNLVHEFQPERYTQWFLREFGQDEYLSLVEDSAKTDKLTLDDLTKLCETLELIISVQKEVPTYKPRYSQKELLNFQEKENEIHDNPSIVQHKPTAICPQVVLKEHGKEVR